MACLTFEALVAQFKDEAEPLAVKRREILARNAKLGRVLLARPDKAPRLARQVAGILERDTMTLRDVRNINAAGRKRARKLARNLAVAA